MDNFELQHSLFVVILYRVMLYKTNYNSYIALTFNLLLPIKLLVNKNAVEIHKGSLCVPRTIEECTHDRRTAFNADRYGYIVFFFYV